MINKKLSLATIAFLLLAAPVQLTGRGGTGAAVGAGLGGFALGGLVGGAIAHDHAEHRSSRREYIRDLESQVAALRDEKEELKDTIRDLKAENRELKRENKKLQAKLIEEKSKNIVTQSTTAKK